KESPRVIASLQTDGIEFRQSRAVRFDAAGFGNPNDAARAGHPQIFNEQILPLPSAQPTGSCTLIDQIKGGCRKFESAQSIHDLESERMVGFSRITRSKDCL